MENECKEVNFNSELQSFYEGRIAPGFEHIGEVLHLSIKNLEEKLDNLSTQIKEQRKDGSKWTDKVESQFDRVDTRFSKIEDRVDKLEKLPGKNAQSIVMWVAGIIGAIVIFWTNRLCGIWIRRGNA